MMRNKCFFVVSIILIMLLCSLNTICYAAVPITEESFKNAIEELNKFSQEGEDPVTFSLESNNMNIVTADNERYSIKYDLTDKPTFISEANIREGMTYEEYNEQMGNGTLTIFGYAAIAYIQQVDFEDSASYILFSILSESLSNNSTLSEGYSIVDDTKSSVEKKNDPKIIYASEFGDKVMEFVNYTYKDDAIVEDSDFNTWSMSTKKIDETDTSCKIVTTLTVNIDGDFEKIKGWADDPIVDDPIIRPEPNKILTEDEYLELLEKEYRKNKNQNKIPNAGEKNTIILVLENIIIVSLIALIVIAVFGRKKRN